MTNQRAVTTRRGGGADTSSAREWARRSSRTTTSSRDHSSIRPEKHGVEIAGGIAKAIRGDLPLQPSGERHGSAVDASRRVAQQDVGAAGASGRAVQPPANWHAGASAFPQQASETDISQRVAASASPSRRSAWIRATQAPHVALPGAMRFAAAIHSASAYFAYEGGMTPRRSAQSRRCAGEWQQQFVQHSRAVEHPQRPLAQGNCSPAARSSHFATCSALGSTPIEAIPNDTARPMASTIEIHRDESMARDEVTEFEHSAKARLSNHDGARVPRIRPVCRAVARQPRLRVRLSPENARGHGRRITHRVARPRPAA